jgi:hypothetical protein
MANSEQMFEVKFFVEDNRLGAAFRALAGIARNVSHKPMLNVAPKGQKGVKAVGNGELMDDLGAYLREKDIKTVSADDMRTFLTSKGYSATSYSYFLAKAVKHGVIKKRGKGSTVVYSTVEE